MKKSTKKEPEPIFGQPVGIPDYTDGILNDSIRKRRVVDSTNLEVPVNSPDVIDLDETINPVHPSPTSSASKSSYVPVYQLQPFDEYSDAYCKQQISAKRG